MCGAGRRNGNLLSVVSAKVIGIQLINLVGVVVCFRSLPLFCQAIHVLMESSCPSNAEQSIQADYG